MDNWMPVQYNGVGVLLLVDTIDSLTQAVFYLGYFPFLCDLAGGELV